MERIAAYLKENAEAIADDVVQEWRQVGEREPWHRIPEHLDQDHLPEMIRALAHAALEGFFTAPARRELVRVGAEHGEHRYRQGVAEEILAREYEMLRSALRRRLKQVADMERASQSIIRIDSGITLAFGASLRGFHRDHIENGGGEFTAELQRYAADWSFGS